MRADTAIIGGSDLYELFDEIDGEFKPDTPSGEPSAPITVARVGGETVAFLARHGAGHRHPAYRIPYRANMWALRSMGCRQIFAPCAVGGLQPHLQAGTFVVSDQLVDHTSGREHTFYNTDAVHINFADPCCPRLRRSIMDAAETRADLLPTAER